MLHFCHESFSALYAVILRCAPRQGRVASLTIWSRPIFLDFQNSTNAHFARAETSSLLSALVVTATAFCASPARCPPGVEFHGAHTTAFNTSQTNRSGLRFSLDRCGSDNTCRRADVHLVGSQPQSQKHSAEELRSQSVRSASCSVQRNAGRALTFRYGLLRDLA